MFISQSLRHLSPYARLVLMLGLLLLCQETSASFIRIRPNTFKEFQSLKCQGKFDKEQYAALNRLCDDCYNLSRGSNDRTACKADCFRNSQFPKCVSALLLDHMEPDLFKMIDIVSGDSPAM
ncbi:crustacean hyperglycemic hormone-like [Macrobrachium nipponense]|uniref:crustacean hyperglycemic hormone-like n=1 Tax=Macrobrachium nipponense TaxID=159736 RepID=UPI0030C7E7DF